MAGCSHRFENSPYEDPFPFTSSGTGSGFDYSNHLKRKYPDSFPRRTIYKDNMELVEVIYSEIDGWGSDNQRGSLRAYVRGCKQKSIANKPELCNQAKALLGTDPDIHSIRAFFEQNFTPYVIYNSRKESEKGLVTGYYVPMLKGSRIKSSRFQYPIYEKPKDFKLPYKTHKRIDEEGANARVICWVEDRVERFFLHIQGSGTVKLDTGEVIGVGYSAQNGYKYTSIGNYMIRNFGLDRNRLSADFIKKWVRDNPDRADEVLHSNKSFVFFQEQASDLATGAMGTNLVPESTIAVDTSHIPLGTPIYIKTTDPVTKEPLNHLYMAQDRGGAIKGIIRADLFFGFGDDAGKRAGNMRNSGEFYMLLPNDIERI
jgi:membrane-bound lytic murein transglycosylase A